MRFEISKGIKGKLQKKGRLGNIKKVVLSDHPLTAKKISKHINYAYTATINALNKSIELGHIRKMRKGRRNVYDVALYLSDRKLKKTEVEA